MQRVLSEMRLEHDFVSGAPGRRDARDADTIPKGWEHLADQLPGEVFEADEISADDGIDLDAELDPAVHTRTHAHKPHTNHAPTRTCNVLADLIEWPCALMRACAFLLAYY